MQRVLVMGGPGAGKSTFARSLADKLGIPFVSLDRLFWQPGWREPAMENFTAAVAHEAEKPTWIIDGNYLSHGAAELRRARADVVVWFDLPRWICLLGVLRRIVTSYGTVRPEMAPGCPEHFDLVFLRYAWDFRAKHRPRTLRYLAALRADQRLVTLTTRAQVARFLAEAA